MTIPGIDTILAQLIGIFALLVIWTIFDWYLLRNNTVVYGRGMFGFVDNVGKLMIVALFIGTFFVLRKYPMNIDTTSSQPDSTPNQIRQRQNVTTPAVPQDLQFEIDQLSNLAREKEAKKKKLKSDFEQCNSSNDPTGERARKIQDEFDYQAATEKDIQNKLERLTAERNRYGH